MVQIDHWNKLVCSEPQQASDVGVVLPDHAHKVFQAQLVVELPVVIENVHVNVVDQLDGLPDAVPVVRNVGLRDGETDAAAEGKEGGSRGG